MKKVHKMDDGQNLKKNYIEIFLIIIFLLYSVNFYGIGYYILLLSLPIFIIYSRRQVFNRIYLITLFILFIFGITFSLSGYAFDLIGIDTAITIIVFPMILYMLGYKIGATDISYYKSYRILFIIIFSLSIFILLSYMKTISIFGNLEGAKNVFGERSLMDVWGKDDIKATVVTVYLSFSLAILPTFFIKNCNIKRKKSIILKFIVLLCFLISLYITAQMASRTSIIIIILSLVANYLLINKFSFKRILLPFVYVLGLIVMWFLFNLDILGVKTWWVQTSVYDRFQSSGLESSRYDAWNDVMVNMFDYPLGGRKINLSISYAHNLWLDVAYDVGVIPFILLIGFTIFSVFSFLRFIRLDHPIYLKSLLISIYVAFLIIFMTEPVLATKERFYFIIFCLIVGITQGLNVNFKKVKSDDS